MLSGKKLRKPIREEFDLIREVKGEFSEGVVLELMDQELSEEEKPCREQYLKC